jgi:hypothetical protein
MPRLGVTVTIIEPEQRQLYSIYVGYPANGRKPCALPDVGTDVQRIPPEIPTPNNTVRRAIIFFEKLFII